MNIRDTLPPTPHGASTWELKTIGELHAMATTATDESVTASMLAAMDLVVALIRQRERPNEGRQLHPRSRDGRILTVDDLIERWGVCRETVLAHVDNAEHPLPYLPLALGKQTASRKNRTLLRSRLESVEAWERAAERRTIATVVPEPTTRKPAAGKMTGYTGKVYTVPNKKMYVD